MRTLLKTFARISVLCYLAVSGIGAVHAFPDLTKPSSEKSSSTNQPSGMQQISESSMSQMTPGCHQQQDDSSHSSASTCKIFCAAMATVISAEIALDLQLSLIRSEISFLENRHYSRELALEPEPPK